jgi:hypothetical protein
MSKVVQDALVAERVDSPARTGGTYPLGVSRPPLDLADLPSPEEAFGVERLGRRETWRYALGPSLISLGAAIGSGEWILGPLTIGAGGFAGIGWLITVAVLLQCVALVEIGRWVTATGEAPIVGYARVPPGRRVWVPLALFAIFAALILGGWAKASAKSLYALLEGHPAGPGDSTTVQLLTFALLGVVVLITWAFRRITRGLELVNGTLIFLEVAFLLAVCVFVVPWSGWWEGIRGFVQPGVPPDGTSATDLGAVVGFAGLTAGLNWAFLGHYRDKGYGMGHRVGFLAGGRGGRQAVRSCGYTFTDDAKNTACWQRWYRLLRLDIYGVFLPGAIIGMLLPTILVRHLALDSGTVPDGANIETFAASLLGAAHGRWLFYATLLVGFLIIFDTLIGILEVLGRNVTDAATTSPAIQARIEQDPRRFYFPAMAVVIIVIGAATTFTQPATLVQLSANVTNAAAMIFPFALIYLNRRLPAAARPPRYAIAALVANAVFFGFFFVNFVVEKTSGAPLVTF